MNGVLLWLSYSAYLSLTSSMVVDCTNAGYDSVLASGVRPKKPDTAEKAYERPVRPTVTGNRPRGESVSYMYV